MTFLLDGYHFGMNLEDDFGRQRLLPHEDILSMGHNTTSHICCIRAKAFFDSRVIMEFDCRTKEEEFVKIKNLCL